MVNVTLFAGFMYSDCDYGTIDICMCLHSNDLGYVALAILTAGHSCRRGRPAALEIQLQ